MSGHRSAQAPDVMEQIVRDTLYRARIESPLGEAAITQAVADILTVISNTRASTDLACAEMCRTAREWSLDPRNQLLALQATFEACASQELKDLDATLAVMGAKNFMKDAQ